MDGYIHSVESFGTVDGPGVRFVVFCQGCPMRCRYCHNPDTWQTGTGMRIAPEELIRQYERNRAFYTRGGITVTGGEPLAQIDFLLEFFALAKQHGIHTCIDTSGITYREGNSAYNDKLDALMGIANALQEMLLYSAPDVLHLLPALPDRLAEGCACGLYQPWGRLDIEWNADEGRAILHAAKDVTITVLLPSGEKKSVSLRSGTDVELSFKR